VSATMVTIIPEKYAGRKKTRREAELSGRGAMPWTCRRTACDRGSLAVTWIEGVERRALGNLAILPRGQYVVLCKRDCIIHYSGSDWDMVSSHLEGRMG